MDLLNENPGGRKEAMDENGTWVKDIVEDHDDVFQFEYPSCEGDKGKRSAGNETDEDDSFASTQMCNIEKKNTELENVGDDSTLKRKWDDVSFDEDGEEIGTLFPNEEIPEPFPNEVSVENWKSKHVPSSSPGDWSDSELESLTGTGYIPLGDDLDYDEDDWLRDSCPESKWTVSPTYQGHRDSYVEEQPPETEAELCSEEVMANNDKLSVDEVEYEETSSDTESTCVSVSLGFTQEDKRVESLQYEDSNTLKYSIFDDDGEWMKVMDEEDKETVLGYLQPGKYYKLKKTVLYVENYENASSHQRGGEGSELEESPDDACDACCPQTPTTNEVEECPSPSDDDAHATQENVAPNKARGFFTYFEFDQHNQKIRKTDTKRKSAFQNFASKFSRLRNFFRPIWDLFKFQSTKMKSQKTNQKRDRTEEGFQQNNN